MINNIVQAEYEHLNDCVLALENSELGRVYFSQEGKANKAISEGISKQEIFVAIDNKGLCLGFIWYIPYGAFHGFLYLHIIAIKEEYRNLGLAKKSYEKCGYIEVGVIPNLYKSGVAEFLMMKEIS